ncbi:MAG: DNA internalization-related competence protein ComEC/Rec2 [Gemmatimonadetes bacterium]|nr:DNA internalization-related competence protein ComEC/Rec2 [Gemmatimonadota bacterium]
MHADADCRTLLPDGGTFTVRGTFEAIPGRGGGAPFLMEEGAPRGCRGRVRVFLRAESAAVRPGDEMVALGRWVQGGGGRERSPYEAGTLVLDSVRTLVPAGPAHRPLLWLRGSAQRRLRELLGDDAPIAEALVLARREGIEPELSERFARAGVAHLLAISGFHIGVVAGVLLGLGGALGLERRRRSLAAVLGTWLYVGLIGAPYAAVRAAVILSLTLAGRLVGRPVDPVGALGIAGCAIVLAVPGAIRDIGFQLSFAAAGGLVLLGRPIARMLGMLGGAGYGQRARHRGLDVLAAGLAATLATAPLTALHFGRVSLVGIPLTLLLAPLLSVAIPQIFLVLALSWVVGGAAHFLAGGLALLLALFRSATELAAAMPGASIAVPRPWLAAGAAGAALAFLTLAYAPPLRRMARHAVAVAGAVAAILLAPLATGHRGADLSLYFLDVGQGDATAIRSPLGRWILVDAGPVNDRWDAGARLVVPFLRREGAARLELLVLTHGDLDHIGGAAAVLDEASVEALLEPGQVAGKEAYLGILERVDRRDIPWIRAHAGQSILLDGVRLDVLHPLPGPLDPARDANDYSVVLRVGYGRFAALLMGDAPADAELTAVNGLPDSRAAILKVGHHGSNTSTSTALLRATRPRAAVISAGRHNRYGHPAPSVLARLARAGVRVLRTDVHGTIRVDAAADGDFRVRTAREGPLPETPETGAYPGRPPGPAERPGGAVRRQSRSVRR